MEYTVEKMMNVIQSSLDLGKPENKIIFYPLNESIKLSKYLNYLYCNIEQTYNERQQDINNRVTEKIKHINENLIL